MSRFSCREETCPGRYTISVTREGYVPAEDPRRGLTAAGLAVTVTAGQRLNDIEFPMLPAPAISGRVIAPNGEPSPAALVLGYRRQYTPYGPQMRVVRKVLTND